MSPAWIGWRPYRGGVPGRRSSIVPDGVRRDRHQRNSCNRLRIPAIVGDNTLVASIGFWLATVGSRDPARARRPPLDDVLRAPTLNETVTMALIEELFAIYRGISS